MTVVILITQRSFGMSMSFHTTEGFSWFFSYSLSKSSWKASMAPPNSRQEMPFLSCAKGPRMSSGGGHHQQSRLPEEWGGSEGKEWLGLGHEFCSTLLKQTHAATWFPLQPQNSETCPLRHPGGRMRPRPCVLGAQRMFPAYHNYRNICAQQLSVELLWKFTVFDCFQNFSLLGLRQGGLEAAGELLQEVREITISRVWMKCGMRVWGVSLEPWVLWTSINWPFLSFLSYSISIYILSMVWTDFNRNLSKSCSSKSQ